LAIGLSLLPGCFLLFPRKADVPTAGEAGGIGAVEGTVTFLNTGAPAPGVSVALFNSSLVAVTDAQGRFSFRSVPTGWRTVNARREGYLVTSDTVHLEPGRTAQVQLLLQVTDGHLHGTSSRVPDLCGSCHVLHQEPLLVGGQQNSACDRCHSSGATPGPPGYYGAAIYGQVLHSAAQAADSPSPVALTLPGAPYRRGDCVNCHEPHGVFRSHPHLLRVAAAQTSNPLCYSCHHNPGSGHTLDYPGEAAADAPDNLHSHPPSPPAGTNLTYPEVAPWNTLQLTPGECYNCHNPHGATDPVTGRLTTAMTRDEGERLCLKCHTTFSQAVGTKHACTTCHNPHLILSGGRIIIQPKDRTRRVVEAWNDPKYVGRHRGRDVLKNSYCLSCHNKEAVAVNPYAGKAKVPDAQNTLFRNLAADPFLDANPVYRDLHAVHVNGPIGLDSGRISNWFTLGRYSYRRCYPAGYGHERTDLPTTAENKAWCVDCHDVHPSAPPASGADRGRLVRTDVITWIDPQVAVRNGYAGKAGCGMSAGVQCHRGRASNDPALTGCDWCHTAPGSPGLTCDCMNQCTTGGRYNNVLSFAGHGHNHGDLTGVTNRRTTADTRAIF
jgi:predicted CXXCH cytochrome family protein